MRKKLHVYLIAFITALLASGCGSDSGQEDAGGTADAPAREKSPPAAETESNLPAREVVIEANDQMQFSIANFDVQPGERVRIVLNNVGTMPKFSMGHNVVVLRKDANVESFAEDAMNAAATDYVPAAREKDIVAHTKLLGGGENDSVTFTAPKESGAYPFICSFPGHYQIGMKGTMTVK